MKKVTTKKQIDKSSNPQDSGLPKLASPAQRALAGAGIQRMEQLTKFTEAEIRQLHGMGPNALGKLRQAMADRGLSFAADKKEN